MKEVGSMSFRHAKWRTRPSLTLMPNIDYAEDYDRVTDTEYKRAAGCCFPEHAECTWMLRTSVPDDVLDDLLEMLKRQPFDCLCMHQPREDLSPPPAQPSRPRVHDVAGVSVELPGGFQGPAMLVSDPRNPDIERDTFIFIGDYHVALKEGELIVDDRPCGRFKHGDLIRVCSTEEVYVNDEYRGVGPRRAITLFARAARLWRSLFGR